MRGAVSGTAATLRSRRPPYQHTQKNHPGYCPGLAVVAIALCTAFARVLRGHPHGPVFFITSEQPNEGTRPAQSGKGSALPSPA